VAPLPLHAQSIHHRLIMPIAQLNAAAKYALAYARSISPEVTALHVPVNDKEAAALQVDWEGWQKGLSATELTQMEIINARHHRPLFPFLNTIHQLAHKHPSDTLTVILPEAVESPWRRYFSAQRSWDSRFLSSFSLISW